MIDDRPAYACHECGTLHGVTPLPPGVTAQCRACGSPLYRQRADSARRALALTVAALVLFVVANVFPFMTFSMEGNARTATILGSAMALYDDGFWPLAIAVGMMAIGFPLLKLVLNLYTLLPITYDRSAPGTKRLLALAAWLRTWAMTEVYLLGVIVAYVKLSDLATLTIGPGLWAFVALILCMAAADNVLDPRAVWWRLGPQSRLGALRASGHPLASCHVCAQVVPLPAAAHAAHCPRCATPLHRRKPDPLARTWAFWLAAVLLYIPANVLPVMTVTSFGQGAGDTILSGVVQLIEAGMWPVAVLVFFASITVPMLKLVCLAYLLLSVQFEWQARPRERTRLYRIVEQVGRWSMIDVFMIAILVVLVDLGEIARIEPGAGAVAFASVVILTMLASASFEPRMIWDNERKRHGRLAAVTA